MQDRRPAVVLAAIFFVLLLCPAAVAQVFPSLPELSSELQQAQRQAAQRALAPAGLTLEGALDPETYVVGPGDEFAVTVGGNFAQDIRALVSADGHLLIPEVGRFAVAGRTLAEVDQEVRPALRRIYRNVPAELALTQPRQFFVHVSGAVTKPGRHLVGPIARAEDAVRAAMDDENPLRILRQIERSNAVTAEQRQFPALRNIRVLHADGATSSVDLRLYYATGDRQHNPYLRDGDVLVVPSFEPYRGAVFVEGPVLAPGIYDYRPGDTVHSLLRVAAGTEDLASLGEVRLVRLDGSSRALAVAGTGENPSEPLQPGDRLVVQPSAPDRGTVAVDGRVLFPGQYPVRLGVTTVGDLLEMAGGLRGDALPGAAYLERRGARDALEDDGRRLVLADDARPGAPIQTEVELRLQAEAFRSLRLADLDFGSRQYLLSELQRTPQLPLDVGRDSDVRLRDGDRLVIPQDPGGIYVFGQVVRSGFLPYEAGRPASAYVEQAGGLTSAATQVYVRRAGSGLVVPASRAGAVERGDSIFVDRREVADSDQRQQLALQEVQVRTQRRQGWIVIGTAVLSSATAVVTALIFSR